MSSEFQLREGTVVMIVINIYHFGYKCIVLEWVVIEFFYYLSKVCAEDSSLMSLITDPSASSSKGRVFSQYPKGGRGPLPPAMGYSMKTNQYRYTEWVHFTGAPLYQPKWNISCGTELYDHKNDPGETWNRADDPAYKEIRLALSAQLHAGWRDAHQLVMPYNHLIPIEIRNDFQLT